MMSLTIHNHVAVTLRREVTICYNVCPDEKIPSGKHTKNYGKSPFLMGISTMNCHFQ